MAQTNIYDKLKELGIELPTAGAPAAAYVMSAQSGNTVYLSGHIAKKDGKVWAGKLGADLGTEDGKAAARSIAVDLLATLHAHRARARAQALEIAATRQMGEESQSHLERLKSELDELRPLLIRMRNEP